MLELTGRTQEADKWYRRARDLDGLRFRAPSALNEIVRNLSRQPGTVLADAESLMVARSPEGLVGRRYLLEHVHPNLDGYAVIADAVEAPLLKVLRDRGMSSDVPVSRSIPSTITPIDSIVAAYRIEILVNSWPFTEQSRTIDDLKAETWEDSLALAYLRKEFTWEALHVQAAERYDAEGRLADAALEYRGLIAATSYNVSPYLRYGVVLQRQGRRAEAREAFTQSLAVERTSTALLKLGEIAYEEGRPADAIGHLIAVATLRVGDHEKARELVDELLEAYPEFERGKAFREFLLRSGGVRK
jgi:tetratricopeptide (TPR) repeat protein